MELFCFASKNLENIRRGIEAKTWAVARVSDSSMKGRKTKARRYFRPGSHGLLYCSLTHTFTTPFIATSEADSERVVIDIWSEPWVLPFSIEPLGALDRQIHADLAKELWPFANGDGGITGTMHCTGAQAFAPKHISQEDWALILYCLGEPPMAPAKVP